MYCNLKGIVRLAGVLKLIAWLRRHLPNKHIR